MVNSRVLRQRHQMLYNVVKSKQSNCCTKFAAVDVSSITVSQSTTRKRSIISIGCLLARGTLVNSGGATRAERKMSSNSRRRDRGGSAGLVLTAAVAAIAGVAAVDHVQAQAEGRPSAVESAWRWFTEELLGEPQGSGGGSSRGGGRYGRLSAADVAALPTREYSVNVNASESERNKAFCAICQEAFRDGERLLRLPCFHEMHHECIRDYLCSAERALCPICRHPVAQTDLPRNE